MKTLAKKIEVMQHFANGGEVEYIHTGLEYWHAAASPNWNWASIDYRIKQPVDPYAELKAAAADPTKQIRCGISTEWSDAGRDWMWNYAPETYEIRDKPKPMKKVKLLAWFDGFGLFWRSDKYDSKSAKRVPDEDKIIEIEVEA